MLCLNPNYNLENSPNLSDYFITTIKSVGKLERVCGEGERRWGAGELNDDCCHCWNWSMSISLKGS